jgi:23S rRNA (cytosine1962-C5)-methyltransferase
MNQNYFDIVVMDPPTFSNSKKMGNDFLDIQRDYAELINDCLQAMNKGGVLYFSTNFRKFELDAAKINSTSIKDITKQTAPFDFEGKLGRVCFEIVK